MKFNTWVVASIIFATIQLCSYKAYGSHSQGFVFNELAAIKRFNKTFSHTVQPGWTGGDAKGRRLLKTQKYLIFGGSGSIFRRPNSKFQHCINLVFGCCRKTYGKFEKYGVGNKNHYTVNTSAQENQDLVADMNSVSELASLPSDRFDVIIASNIPFEHFSSGCFINARRLLKSGGFLIINNLQGEITPERTAKKINACLAKFGFFPAREMLDSFESQLRSIGFTEVQFAFGKPNEDPCVIYRKK